MLKQAVSACAAALPPMSTSRLELAFAGTAAVAVPKVLVGRAPTARRKKQTTTQTIARSQSTACPSPSIEKDVVHGVRGDPWKCLPRCQFSSRRLQRDRIRSRTPTPRSRRDKTPHEQNFRARHHLHAEKEDDQVVIVQRHGMAVAPPRRRVLEPRFFDTSTDRNTRGAYIASRRREKAEDDAR